METTGAKGKGKEEKEEGGEAAEGYKEVESEGIVVQERERKGKEKKDGVGTRG